MAISDKKLVQKHRITAQEIIKLSEEYKGLSDEDLSNKTDLFVKQLQNNEVSLSDLIVPAFATAREAARRVLGLEAYEVQLVGALVLFEGDVAEMKTGEGKTLTGLMAAYICALEKKGVHIVTVNEYLSKRDSEINGKVFNFLKLSVGLNARKLTKQQKREAYSADITYTTNSELGFDYLRDNMAKTMGDKVQRGLNFTIIDEADSILIDESRTPLIIAGGRQNRNPQYKAADAFVKTLKRTNDVDIDIETKQVSLTSEGVIKAEKMFSVGSLFDIKNTELYHIILNALKARFVFKNGIEYVVKNGEIVLVDSFTGRLMEGRSYSDGLQQALQAKENLEIENETSTMATITYQNLFRLYNKLSGMTGTAKTEEEEFVKIYNMRVVKIPTNKPIIRNDQPDYMFSNKNAKLKALIKEIKVLHELGQPILIGTTSVESSEVVANHLRSNNLKFEMLNAKNHEREADIIEKAGHQKSITVATNMAGRGTDIKLGSGVKELGGLAVFGVERNESRRIDNQLRGRAGRQGDPGFSRFYVSMEDELMMRFGADRIKKMFNKLGDDYIKSKMLTRAVTNAQKKVEGSNFDQRKNILDYDNVLAQHREAMYSRRDLILTTNNIEDIIKKMQYTAAFDITNIFSEKVQDEMYVNYERLIKGINGKVVIPNSVKIEDINEKERNEIAKIVSEKMFEFYKVKNSDLKPEVQNDIARKIILQSFDNFWTKHIDEASKLRSGIYLRSYAQTNPLHAYVEEAAALYKNMQVNIAHDVVIKLATVTIKQVTKPQNDSEQDLMIYKQKG